MNDFDDVLLLEFSLDDLIKLFPILKNREIDNEVEVFVAL